MSGRQFVDTEGIASVITKLRGVNENINSCFNTLEKKAKLLENDWKSPAGSRACTVMYELFNGSETRGYVIQNYINLLEQQINPGYESAENANKSLADQFK